MASAGQNFEMIVILAWREIVMMVFLEAGYDEVFVVGALSCWIRDFVEVQLDS